MRDENINPSTHTQTAHSPEGRNLQMALSYVWLLIKPSHLARRCTAPSLIFLPHPSVSLPLHRSCCHTDTRVHTHAHICRGRAYIQVSPRALIRLSLIPSSDLKLSSLVHLRAAASTHPCICISISHICLCCLSTITDRHYFTHLPRRLYHCPLLSLYLRVDRKALTFSLTISLCTNLRNYI